MISNSRIKSFIKPRTILKGSKYKVLRNTFKKVKRNLRNKTYKKTNLKKIRTRIKKRIVNGLNPIRKLVPNLARNSFLNRFLLNKKRKRLYRRTNRVLNATLKEEDNFYSLLSRRIKKMQKKMFYTKEFFFNRKTPLSKMRYSPAKLYVTHKKRNTFCTIQKVAGPLYDKNTKVVYKLSCGNIGYRGPKKRTHFARQEVVKKAGNLLNDKLFTATDIIMSKLTWGRRQLRSILNNLIYIRIIRVNRNRSHGRGTRLQKEKRK